jgi:hypothetical protein
MVSMRPERGLDRRKRCGVAPYCTPASTARVQVIKGWLDDDGETHERVYDVAWADRRTAANGKVPAIGSTVDLARATYDNY